VNYLNTRKLPLEEKFWARVSPEPMSGCWLWTGQISPQGYAILSCVAGHRISYELYVGPIPKGLEIDHLCRVRCCVNPRHLEAVTRKENVKRGESPVAKCIDRPTCAKGHLLSGYNLRMYNSRQGWTRVCRQCHRESRMADYYRRRQSVPSTSIRVRNAGDN
jgi:hypothetical protein